MKRGIRAGTPLVNWLLRIQAYGLALYSAFFRLGVSPDAEGE
jgi:hypothetical protein